MAAEPASIPHLVYKRIQTLFDGADEKEQVSEKLLSEANADRWEAARLAAERNVKPPKGPGDTQEFIASQIGRPQSFISLCIAIWKDYGQDYSSGRITSVSFGELLVVYQQTPPEDRKATVEEAEATGQSAASLANRRRRRHPPEGELTYPRTENSRRILDLLIEAAERGEGLLDEEIEETLKIKHTPRRLELVNDGWVVDAGERRKTSANTKGAIVWFLSEKGAKQVGVEHGWKAKPKSKSKSSSRSSNGKSNNSKPKAETTDERRRRLEREAIKRAEKEFDDGNRGAARFRSSLKYLRELILAVEQLHELLENESYACPPNTQEALLHCLDHFSETTNDTAEDLRRHQPPPVDLEYYELLGVPPEATAVTIKKAYWELARIYHPDTQSNGNGNSEKFRRIADAYATLSDPEKRRQYNAEGVRR